MEMGGETTSTLDPILPRIGNCAALCAAIRHIAIVQTSFINGITPAAECAARTTRRKHMNSVKSWKTILAACVAMTAASAYGAARAGPRWVDRLWRRSRQHALQPAETGQRRQREESQGRVGLETRH